MLTIAHEQSLTVEYRDRYAPLRLPWSTRPELVNKIKTMTTIAPATRQLCCVPGGRTTGSFSLQRRGVSRQASQSAMSVAAKAGRGGGGGGKAQQRQESVVLTASGGVVVDDAGERKGERERETDKSASAFASIAAATMVFVSVAIAPGAALAESEFYIEDIPQGLSSGERDVAGKAPNLASLVKGPNGKEIEKCATKCIATCTRGGSGAPGLGPMSIRKAPVVFKDGFRSRAYCLSECTEICSITVNSDRASYKK